MGQRCADRMRQMLLLVVAVAATSAMTTDAFSFEEDNVVDQARGVLRRHCWRCHQGVGSDGGDFDILNVHELAEDFDHVTPGQPETSLIFSKIINDAMPPIGVRQRDPVTGAEADIVRRWISQGAPEFPVAEKRKFLDLETVLDAVVHHLQQAPPESHPYLRFFTLHHLYNNSVVWEEDLQLFRAALAKTINSLSWKQRITLPQAIDRGARVDREQQNRLRETVFVIDVRDFGWAGHAAWRKLQSRYPYGLSSEFHPNERCFALEEEICSLTDTEIPLIRADWFVANATRPPLYHDLLQLPETASELERRLGVNIARDFRAPRPDRIARAGFAKSGISGQNRMVQRSDSVHGAYWKSYDFRPGTARSKLTRFPLGPRDLFGPDEPHPYDRFAFEHDGGEIIFALPNGLQAYMLVDGQDRRIDAGPIDVVGDALKTSGTPAIVNGLSCMACHKHGMIDFTDSIRNGSAMFDGVLRHVQRLYPPQREMDELVQQDRARFLQALEATIGPHLQRGRRVDVPLEDFPEPIGEVARWHRLVYLDLATVACELELGDPQELLSIGRRRLRQLGLEPLMNGGVIGRMEWEAFERREGNSLMQQTAAELNYSPLRPF